MLSKANCLANALLQCGSYEKVPLATLCPVTRRVHVRNRYPTFSVARAPVQLSGGSFGSKITPSRSSVPFPDVLAHVEMSSGPPGTVAAASAYKPSAQVESMWSVVVATHGGESLRRVIAMSHCDESLRRSESMWSCALLNTNAMYNGSSHRD
jgi:hypothetical protein